MGHSFGGYIAGNYSLRYPNHVKKLIMMSPIGVSGYEDLDADIQTAIDEASEK